MSTVETILAEGRRIHREYLEAMRPDLAADLAKLDGVIASLRVPGPAVADPGVLRATDATELAICDRMVSDSAARRERLDAERRPRRDSAAAAARDGVTAPVAPAPRLVPRRPCGCPCDSEHARACPDRPVPAADHDDSDDPLNDPTPLHTPDTDRPAPARAAIDGDTTQMRRVREAIWRIREPRFTTNDVRRAGGFGASSALQQVMTKGIAQLVDVGELVRLQTGRGPKPGVYRRGDKFRRDPDAAAEATTAVTPAPAPGPLEVFGPRPADAPARPRFAGETMPINPMRQVAVDDTPTLATAVGIPAGRRGAVA